MGKMLFGASLGVKREVTSGRRKEEVHVLAWSWSYIGDCVGDSRTSFATGGNSNWP